MIFNLGGIGCFSTVLFLFLSVLFFKYIHVILLVALIWYASNKIANFFNERQNVMPPKFKAEAGKVYKQCSFCGTKADRTAKKCPNCQKSFE